jgi:hypothetical protein
VRHMKRCCAEALSVNAHTVATSFRRGETERRMTVVGPCMVQAPAPVKKINGKNKIKPDAGGRFEGFGPSIGDRRGPCRIFY